MPDANRREVLKGTIWSALSWSVGLLTGPVVAVFLVRSMSHQQYGALALATDAVGLIAATLSFGLGPALTQIAVTERVRSGFAGERAAIGRTVWLSLVATAASIPCVAVAAAIFLFDNHLRPALWALCVMAPLALLAPVSGVLSGAFRALQWPRLLAYTTVASSVATGSVVLGLILWGSPSSVRVGLAFDIRPIVALPLLVLPLVRWWRAGRHLESTSVSTVTTRRIVSFAVGFMFVMTFGAVISQLDVLVLGAFRGARVTGFYSPASAMGNFVLGIPAVVGSFFLPAVTRLSAQHDQRGVAALYHWTTRISIALAAPAVAVLLVCPAALLSTVFGHALSIEATPLRMIGLGVLVYVLAGFNGVTLDAQGLVRLTTYRQLIAIGITAAACVVLVPPFAAVGAGAATAVGLIADNVICSVTLFRRYRLLPWDWRAAAVAAAFGLSLIPSFLMQSVLPGNLARCAITAVCAAAITPAAAVIFEEKEERRSMINAIRKRINPFKSKMAVAPGGETTR